MDFPIIRFADILLMYAECENEINGGQLLDAYTAINLVRGRARTALINDMLEVRDILPDLKELNFSQFQKAVRQERKLEFYWEGLKMD